METLKRYRQINHIIEEKKHELYEHCKIIQFRNGAKSINLEKHRNINQFKGTMQINQIRETQQE